MFEVSTSNFFTQVLNFVLPNLSCVERKLYQPKQIYFQIDPIVKKGVTRGKIICNGAKRALRSLNLEPFKTKNEKIKPTLYNFLRRRYVFRYDVKVMLGRDKSPDHSNGLHKNFEWSN